MVAKSRGLKVSLSPAALASLDQIWDWNAQTCSPDHADRYIAFLRTETAKLAHLYFVGTRIPTRPELNYITIRKHRSAHGHVVAYEFIGDVVHVLNYYHTAQDWQNKLQEEMP